MKNLNKRILNQQARLVIEVFETLVPQVLEHHHPADRVLQRFLKARRELGSRDRRFLSECFFSYFRWLGWTRMLNLGLPETVALSWLLDQADLHPALQSASISDWEPLGGKTLDEKREMLSAWFPASPALDQSALLPPCFKDAVVVPAGRETLFYESLQQRPPTWVRLRTPAFKKVLTEAGLLYREHPAASNAVSIGAGGSLGPLGHSGQFEVQDIASQAVALIAAPTAGSDWWDACSGAGGKALHLADLMNFSGKVLATDVRVEALQECKKRARTDGISIVHTQVHDLAKNPPFMKKFDGVLVDAPCSGWGTWSRNPDARWRSDERNPVQKRNLQVKMLRNAVQCVKPDGLLIYAVCTFTRAETADVLERFMAEYPDFSLDPFMNPLTGQQTDGSLQIWPWEGPGDGMFIARFRRTACI